MTLGQYIRRCRECKGASLRKFAQAVGISPTMMCKIEHDEKGFKAGVDLLKRIASELQVNSDCLLALAGKIDHDILAIIIKDPLKMCKLIRENETKWFELKEIKND
jgi:transcriptional regulator with XRE-family HTH domain